MNTTSLKEIFSEKGPCEGCDFNSKCGNGLACKEFKDYVDFGKKPEDSNTTKRIPTKFFYNKIFPKDSAEITEEELLSYGIYFIKTNISFPDAHEEFGINKTYFDISKKMALKQDKDFELDVLKASILNV